MRKDRLTAMLLIKKLFKSLFAAKIDVNFVQKIIFVRAEIKWNCRRLDILKSVLQTVYWILKKTRIIKLRVKRNYSINVLRISLPTGAASLQHIVFAIQFYDIPIITELFDVPYKFINSSDSGVVNALYYK